VKIDSALREEVATIVLCYKVARYPHHESREVIWKNRGYCFRARDRCARHAGP